MLGQLTLERKRDLDLFKCKELSLSIAATNISSQAVVASFRENVYYPVAEERHVVSFSFSQAVNINDWLPDTLNQ